MRSAVVKHDPGRAAALQHWLEAVEGVDRAEINFLTGSVLIRYQASVIDGDALIAELRERKWITKPVPRGTTIPLAPDRNGLQHKLAKAVVISVAEVLIERSVMALVTAML